MALWLQGCGPPFHRRNRFLVALAAVRDLSICPKHLFIAARTVQRGQRSAELSSCYHGDGKSRTPASAGTISAKKIKIQKMTAACGGIDHNSLASRISMASTHGSLRQRLALRSASAQLPTHSAWL